MTSENTGSIQLNFHGQSVPMMASMPDAAAMTNLPYHVIRNLTLDHKIKFISSGSKKYVNMGDLIRYCEQGEGEAFE